MSQEEKLALARKFYDNLNLKDYNLEINRDNEIKADFIWVANMRGPSGLIVDDAGKYLFCQSRHGYDYWKKEFKKGVRSN